jgi:hypothetical protein
MQDPLQIWDFGRWIARREAGYARLSWTGGEMVLGIRDGRVHSAEGIDPSELSGRLGRKGPGGSDLLAEARALGKEHRIPETRAMGAAKEMLQASLRGWLRDPDRRFELDDGAPPKADGATISITHAMVELILADTENNVAGVILPDRGVVLRRARGFLEHYAPLRLSEEADLIVASMSGERTAADIAKNSPHNVDEVVRLEAALLATGMLEASDVVEPQADLEWPDSEPADDEPTHRRFPAWWLGLAAAVLVVVVAVAAFVFSRGRGVTEPVEAGSSDWGVVVEMGCEPQDLQRVLRKRSQHPKVLRTVAAEPGVGETCFRLVWGSFPTREAAEVAMDDIPSGLVEAGFQPHVIDVAEPSTDGGGAVEE